MGGTGNLPKQRNENQGNMVSISTPAEEKLPLREDEGGQLLNVAFLGTHTSFGDKLIVIT